MTRKLRRALAGHVSKRVLLKVLLPFSTVSLFGTVVVAAFYFPVPYHWTTRAISDLASPRDNPDAYWLPCLGLVASSVLALPFGGYVQRHLRGITPRLARAAGVAFALACILLLLTGIVPEQVSPVFGWRQMHEVIVRGSATAFFIGMLCCCLCAFRDRYRIFGGQRSLCAALSRYWRWTTLLPVGCAITIGVLQFLGQVADLAWAEGIRQLFRSTVIWHVAFWEWTGLVIIFAFMVITVLLLPEGCKPPAAAVAVPARQERMGVPGDGAAGALDY